MGRQWWPNGWQPLPKHDPFKPLEDREAFKVRLSEGPRALSVSLSDTQTHTQRLLLSPLILFVLCLMNGNITSRAIMQNFAALLPMSSPEFLICAAAFLYYLEPSRTHTLAYPSLPLGRQHPSASGLDRGPRIRLIPWELVREINVYICNHIMLGTVAKGRSGNCRGAGQTEMYFACKSLGAGDIEWGLKGCISQSVSSVAQSCPTLCDPMNRSTPGLPVHPQLPEFTQTHIHWVGDAIQPSHPLSSPSPPAPSPSQHQSLFQWVNSSHEVAKVLEFQL